MSNIIEIKEFNGLFTYGDQDDMPKGSLQSCKNAISKYGKLIKTYGFYNFDTEQHAISPTSGYVVYGFICHVDSNYTTPNGYRYYLVRVNTTSKLLQIFFYNDSPATDTWDLLSLTNTYYHKAAIYNPIVVSFDAIRFLPGNVGLADGTHESKGLWYGYIDRDYFWNSAILSQAAFYESLTTPEIATTLLNATAKNNEEVYGTLAADDYYYKFTLIFDGVQETLLPTAYVASGTTTVNQVFRIQYTLLASALNKRVTGINIYRSITSAVAGYKLIKRISTLDATYDPNLKYNTGSNVGYGLYVPDKNWPDLSTDYYLYVVSAGGNNQIYDIIDNSVDILTLHYCILHPVSVWATGSWKIYNVNDNIFSPDCGNTFQDNELGDWTETFTTFEVEESLPYYGSNCLACVTDVDTGYGTAQHNTTMTITPSTDYYMLGVLKNVNAGSVRVEYRLDGGEWTTCLENTIADGNWHVLSNTFNSGLATSLDIRIYVGGYDSTCWVNMLYVCSSNVEYDSGTATGYGGIDTIINSDFDFDRNDELVGYRALVGTNANGNNDSSAQRRRIIHNVQKAVQVDTDFSDSYIGSNLKSYICDNYLWQKNTASGYVDLWFYDDGYLTEGSEHPIVDEVSIKVNGKFGRILNNRLYQYNVVLDPGGKNESQINGLTRSELNQYDVNPVSNLVVLPDREGGEGTGLAVCFGGLIAFKKRAIFRLIMNADTGDVAEIRESKYNEGNLAPNGYVEVGDEIYYCSYSSINRLNPNIGAETEATPLINDRITEPIKDVYMALSDSEKELIQANYDQLNNEIIYRFKNNLIYAYRIDTNEWRQIDSNIDVDIMGIDEVSNMMIFDDTNKKVYKISSDLTTGKESVAFNLKTKEFYVGNDEKKEVVRYFTIVYKSAVDLTLNMYVDNNYSSAVFTTTIPASSVITQLRLAVRYWCGRFAIEILESAGSTSAVEVNSIKIETG